MAKAFSDIQMTFCISTKILLGEKPGQDRIRSEALWSLYHDSCTDSLANPIALALPFWLRLMQCLKVYSQTREQKNLWNALKYSTAMPLVYFGYMRNLDPSQSHRLLFIAAAVVQSTFTFIWDVLMDWGLLQRVAANINFSGPPNACCRLTLRERLLVSQQKYVYLTLCGGNLL